MQYDMISISVPYDDETVSDKQNVLTINMVGTLQNPIDRRRVRRNLFKTLEKSFNRRTPKRFLDTLIKQAEVGTWVEARLAVKNLVNEMYDRMEDEVDELEKEALEAKRDSHRENSYTPATEL